MGEGRSVGWCVLAIASLVACKAAPEEVTVTPPPLEPSPMPEAVTPEEREPSALPPEVPPGAPATLGVNDMAGHPARWNGETVVLFARLRYTTVSCTSSVPAHCSYEWQLVDAEDARSMVVVLEHAGVDVPHVCRAAASQLVAESPCAAGELDPTQRYRLEGQFVYDAGQPRFAATRIEAVSP